MSWKDIAIVFLGDFRPPQPREGDLEEHFALLALSNSAIPAQARDREEERTKDENVAKRGRGPATDKEKQRRDNINAAATSLLAAAQKVLALYDHERLQQTDDKSRATQWHLFERTAQLPIGEAGVKSSHNPTLPLQLMLLC